jgi:putative phosphotransacetylase
VEVNEGVIIAKRHIHLTPQDAEKFNLKDKQSVDVKIVTDGRALIFGDVVIRVRSDFSSAMHIDTDEGNAAGLTRDTYGIIL